MNWTLVTGGAKGLGAQICIDLASAGHNILIHYRTSDKEALEVAERCRDFGVQVNFFQSDFSNAATIQKDIQRLIQQFPGIKNLINNVGPYVIHSALETKMKEMTDLFQVNLYTPFLLIQSLLPAIRSQMGSVITIGVAGLENGRVDTYSMAYTMSKQALLTMTKAFAKELAPFSVRVNMVSPGHLVESVDAPKDPTQLIEHRVGNPQEITRVIAFLLEKESVYITGQNIEVAGGVRL